MITREQVQRIAALAHIRLQEQEVEKFQKDFASILEYFEILNELDVSGVDPMTHSREEARLGREDTVQEEPQERLERLLALFPLKKGPLLQVPALPWQSGKSTNNS